MIHVDGAEVYSNAEFDVYSISSILAQAASCHVWDSKFPCFTLGHDRMHDQAIKRDVNTKIARVLAWSLECCATGLWPETGPFGECLVGFRKERAGTCLAGGRRGCFFAFRADAKARKIAHEFPRSYLHSWICEACMAQRPHKGWQPLLNYKNFYSSAAHRMTTISSLALLLYYSILTFSAAS